MSLDPKTVVRLKALYEENDYPSDRLFKDESAIMGFTDEFNRRNGDSLTRHEVAVAIERIRKDKRGTGGLPLLGRQFTGPKFVATKTAQPSARGQTEQRGALANMVPNDARL